MNAFRSNLIPIVLTVSALALSGCLESNQLDVSSEKDFGPQGLSIESEDLFVGGLSKIVVSLNYVTPKRVTFRLRTQPVDAVEDFDYKGIDQTYAIEAGSNRVTIPFVSFRKNQLPADRRVLLAVSEVENATALKSEATVKIKQPAFARSMTGIQTLAMGRNNVCVQYENKTYACFGSNAYAVSSTDAVASTRTLKVAVVLEANATKIQGLTDTMCLLANGLLTCWGYNGDGNISRGNYQTPLAAGALTTAQGVIDFAASDSHTNVVLADGSVVSKGYRGYATMGDGSTSGYTTSFVAATGLPGPVGKISAAIQTTCAIIASSGAVYCWGLNTYGDVGKGSVGAAATPTATSIAANAVALASGFWHNCALLADGTVKCWGNNQYGQVGLDTSGASVLSPTSVVLPRPATKISANGSSTCALLDSGEVYCWGQNSMGQLGDGTTTDRATPVKVLGLSGRVLQLANSADSTCAIVETDRKILCWGNNDSYQSTGSTVSMTYPVDLDQTSGIKFKDFGVSMASPTSSSSQQSACGVLENGEAQCFGDNTYRTLGRSSATAGYLSLAAVTGLSAGLTSAVKMGAAFACALLEDTGVKCWGYNSQGAAGNNLVGATVDPAVTPTGLSSGVKQLDSKFGHSCAVMNDGTVKCWGASAAGEAGACSNVGVPTSISGIADAVSVAVGWNETCAVTSSGAVKCWGSNAKGLFGNGVTSTGCSLTPVTAAVDSVQSVSLGYNFACALLVNGSVKCWGSNSWGQLGRGDTLSEFSPVAVPDLGAGRVKQIVTGYEHACALLVDGGVRCWGSDVYDELGINTNNTNLIYRPTQPVGLGLGIKKLTSSDRTTCAITDDGFVKCWGGNTQPIQKTGYGLILYPHEVSDTQIAF